MFAHIQYLRKLFQIALTVISVCINYTVIAQKANDIDSLSQVSTIVDTVDVKLNHVRILMTWLNDTIEISSLTLPVKYNLEVMRKIRKDSTFKPSPEAETRLIDFIKTASQNCYSFALQKYFAYNNIYSDNIFNQHTALTRHAMENMIENTFTKVVEFSTKNKKHFKDSLENGTLIIFRNKHDWIIHAFYYENGLFYSKNGGWAAKEFKKMKEIFKSYWDTELVQFYEMDTQIFNDFIQKKS